MPIYEFYCPDCHTVFSFHSRRINTTTTPDCPGCSQSNKLQRQISSFAVVASGRQESENPPSDLPIDESKMERAMETLASQAEGMDENDPRAMAQLMRRFSHETGLEYGEQMETALSRLEAGENPEAVEADMGAALEGEDMPFRLASGKGKSSTGRPPKKDDTLYEM